MKNIYQENEVDLKSTTEEFSAVQKEGEIEGKSVAEKFSVTASVGKQYRTNHYDLDAI